MKRKDTRKESTLWESTPAVSTGHSDPANRGTVSCSIGAEDTPLGSPPVLCVLGSGYVCTMWGFCILAHHLGAKTFSELHCNQILFPPGPSPLVFNQKAQSCSYPLSVTGVPLTLSALSWICFLEDTSNTV